MSRRPICCQPGGYGIQICLPTGDTQRGRFQVVVGGDQAAAVEPEHKTGCGDTCTLIAILFIWPGQANPNRANDGGDTSSVGCFPGGEGLSKDGWAEVEPAAQAAIAHHTATVTGRGSVARGGSVSAGQGGVAVKGNEEGGGCRTCNQKIDR
jgi:hypothetical protein